MAYRLNRLDGPVFIAVWKPLLTEFYIHHRLESCGKNTCFLSRMVNGATAGPVHKKRRVSNTSSNGGGGSGSRGSANHLTGDQIRRLREQRQEQKAREKARQEQRSGQADRTSSSNSSAISRPAAAGRRFQMHYGYKLLLKISHDRTNQDSWPIR